MIVNLSLKVHSQGVLSLEEIYPSLEFFLLRKGIEMMIEGCNTEDLKFIIDNYITARDYFEDELLERLIIREGVLLLVKDENYGKLLFEKILSMLGEDFFEDVESSIFEDKIMNIVDSQEMENIIMKSGYLNMALALKYCSCKVCEHVKNLSSEFISQLIKDTMDYMDPCRLKDLIDAQNFVLLFFMKIFRNGIIK